MAGRDEVIVQVSGGVATLVLNRPDQRNALNPDILARIENELERFARDGAVRAVLFRGEGEKAFSAGYDITAIPAALPLEPALIGSTPNPVERCMSAVARFPYPTIAMINGAAFGAGLELAICCDLRIACEEAQMGMPPAKLGLVYMPDGLKRFIDVVGLASAKEIFLTGRSYDAARARELGLVHYLVERADLEPFTRALAEEIAGNAPLALRGLKEVLSRVNTWPFSDAERRACEEIVAGCFASQDFQEGRLAFIEKRKPRFTGR